MANKCIYADGFVGAVVDEADLRQAHDDGRAVLSLELRLHGCADDLIGRDAVGFVGPRAHESYLTTGDDESFEAVTAEIGEEFNHWLVDELRIRMVEFAIVGLGEPVGNGVLKLFVGHAGAGCGDDLEDALVAGCGDGFHVTFENAFEGLLRLPLGVLGGHLFDAVEGKLNLGVQGGLNPEGAVVIEGGDAVGDGNEVGSTLFRDSLDEGDDGFFGSSVVPRGERVHLGVGEGERESSKDEANEGAKHGV